MISEHVLLALLKQSDTRTNADIEMIASFCRLFTVFNEIPEHLFNSFCRIIEIDEYDPGAVIYNEGDPGSDWYIIVEGSVNVYSNVNSTAPVRGVMKIGDSFGRAALTQEVARTETVVCIDHVYVLRVNRKQYQEMVQNANSDLDSVGQTFANAFLQGLHPLPGMHIATSISRRVFPSNAVVIKQREEAEDLEQKWIAARNEELERTEEAANAKLSTARILAMCNQYETAKTMRDTAQGLIRNEKTARMRKIDADFTKRYKKMTARHFSEFQFLHKHLTCLMDTLREKVKAQGLAAEADLMMEEARNATLIIQTVAEEAVSPIAKENVIRAFSPRSQKRPGSRSSMSMSRSSGRNTPTKAATSPRFQTPVGK